MNIIQKIAHRTNYGTVRTASSIKYIVIHFTANDGDSSWNNASYFRTNANLKASAHYFVDDDYIYQSVPDDYVAYSVGVEKDKKGNPKIDTSKGGATFYGKCTNANSISIELCDTNKNGEYYPTQATINRAIELTKYLMKRYDIQPNKVIRHFDVTGKACPVYWVNNGKWELEFHSYLVSVLPEPIYKEGWVKDETGWWYQYEDGTYPKSEWKEIKGVYYYFKADGYMASDEFIKSENYATNQKLYYVNKEGAWDTKSYRWMQDAKGWWLAVIGGTWYAHNEWAKVDGYWYYFDSDGYMVKNRIKSINGNIYEFDGEGRLK